MSDQPKEEKKIDYLKAAKSHQKDATSNNSRAVENAISCALIFIGEQLAEQNKFLSMIVVDLDNLTRTWGRTE